MKKETAVEWLLNNLITEPFSEKQFEQNAEMWNIALEMEKEQIINAHGDKKKTKSNPNSIVTYGYTYTGKDYYNDKYEKL
jgi:hypothetical protein